MLRKFKYFFICLIIFFSVCNIVDATTIKETVDKNDRYDTIERNTTIIGVSKFLPDTVITASKASIAGSNDAKQYFENNKSFDGYIYPQIYIYYGAIGGWYSLDENNNVSIITDEKTLKELSEIDIYFVDNIEKIIVVDCDKDIDETKLPSNVKYENNKLYVNATLKSFNVYDKTGAKINYIYDYKSSSYIINLETCFRINGNAIIDYDINCGSNVTIPSNINDKIINSISDGAFENKNIERIVIPKSITNIGNNAFANNPLISVIINDKYNLDDFNSIGSDAFGSFDNISYNNILTNTLSLINENYKINVYDGFDTSLILDNHCVAYILSKSILFELNNIKGLNFINITRDYDVNGNSNLKLKVDDNNDIFTLTLLNEVGDKKYSVSKKIVPEYNKTGSAEQMSLVNEAINNIKTDEMYGDNFNIQNFEIVTNLKNLLDIENRYDVDFLYELRMGSSFNTTDNMIESGFAGKNIYVFKDNILYSRISKIAIIEPWKLYKTPFFINRFYPSIKYEDYSNIELYIDDGLKSFEKRTNITDYNIKMSKDGFRYEINDNVSDKYKYIVTLLNRDGEEIWQLYYNS